MLVIELLMSTRNKIILYMVNITGDSLYCSKSYADGGPEVKLSACGARGSIPGLAP